jgi:hypothetical protein
MMGQGRDFLPGQSAVFRLEKRSRLYSSVYHLRLAIPSRFNVPDVLYSFAAFTGKAGLLLSGSPGASQVVAILQLGTPDRVVSGREDATAVAVIVGYVEDLRPGIVGPGNFPVPAAGVAGY